MGFDIELAGVPPIAEMAGDDQNETNQLNTLFLESKCFLSAFNWCLEIRQSYFGHGIGGIFGIYLFNILPGKCDADEWIWVIVGDLPSAYISTVGNQTPYDALKGYIYEMKRWVEAAANGKPVSGLIPVNVEPTEDWAHELESRLEFFEEQILPYWPFR